MFGSGAYTLMVDNPNYYEQLLNQVPQYPNPCFYQIELDLHRTFSSDENFYTKINEDKLRRILSAYIKRNPTVGYCQGLNFITAVLITQLSELESFWVLCQLIESILPVDYFNLMTGVVVDQKVLWILLEDHFPDIHKHMLKHNFQSESFTTQWLVCLFANTLKFDSNKEDNSCLSLLNVWDYMFTLGISGIFKVALGIFGHLK